MQLLTSLYHFWDKESVWSTVFCVGLFWTLVSLFAMTLRSILLRIFRPSLETNQLHGSKLTTANVSSNSIVSRCEEFVINARSDPSLLLALLDAVATMEVCACSLECWPIKAAAGHFPLLIAFGLNAIRATIFTFKDCYGNPCSPWYRLITGKSTPFWVGITWSLQLLGARAALCLAESWWSLKLTIYHTARYDLAKMPVDAHRHADLQVSPLSGFVIEALGNFIDIHLCFLFTCLLVSLSTIQYESARHSCSNELCSETHLHSDENCGQPIVLPQVSRLSCLVSFMLRMCINLYVISKGLALTGMYLNPANAFIQCWSIGGVPSHTHLFVYWLGPFVGVWLAVNTESIVLRLLDYFGLDSFKRTLRVYMENETPNKPPVVHKCDSSETNGPARRRSSRHSDKSYRKRRAANSVGPYSPSCK